MPENIDDGFALRQRARRRKANLNALLAAAAQALSAVLLLWLRRRFFPRRGLFRTGLLILAAADLILIIPILAVRRQRIKEISEGEEDEARNY